MQADATGERMTWQECQQCSFTLFNSTYCSQNLTADEQAALNDCDPARLQARPPPLPACPHAGGSFLPPRLHEFCSTLLWSATGHQVAHNPIVSADAAG